MASTSAASTTPTFNVPCFVHGYHVYQRIWSSTVGILTTALEPDNAHDKHAVAHDKHAVAVLDDTHCMVGHVPWGVEIQRMGASLGSLLVIFSALSEQFQLLHVLQKFYVSMLS